jgi:hypothetical protein
MADYRSILKPWVLKARGPASVVAALVFFILVGMAASGHYNNPWGRFLYATWTGLLPLWFFVERVYGIDLTQADNSGFEAKRTEFKAMQEAARTVWAGCAAALGILMIKASL